MSLDREQLADYLRRGAEDIVKDIVRVSAATPAARLFILKYAAAAKKAEKIRARAAAGGEPTPTFLIASIASACNLHCAGCYARANRICGDAAESGLLTASAWRRIFLQARDLGIGFILLAGGEPMLRPDVLEAAAGIPEIIFPVFTNGTLLDGARAGMFSEHRNLLPILSIEGGATGTDARRGEGVYAALLGAMGNLRGESILFGASVTVTTENIREVTSPAFIGDLAARGCRAVIYVEYVPTDGNIALAPDDECRTALDGALQALRGTCGEMILLSFPGDELASGGCLASGRGFFHINPTGGAEPCPFSPYSDTNLKTATLREALRSPLFTQLKSMQALQGAHRGGCVLFERREAVEALLNPHK